jgi:hypothetical protein
MRIRPVGVAALLACGVILAACQPVTPAPQPPPPPPTTTPPAGGMSLGWTDSGINGPIATDATDNTLWAMNKGSGILDEVNPADGSVVRSHAVPLDGAQHFPTSEVSSGWVIIEQAGNKVFGMKTDGTGTPWTSVALDGLVQARPLVVNNIVVVATENDSLYGLNLTTGVVSWGPTNFGSPETLADARQFPGLTNCGDVDPLGITGNPVLGANGHVYAVAEFAGNHATNTQPTHNLVAVDPATGAKTLTPHNVDVATMTNVAGEQQRAGLLAMNGNIYIGFGGLDGDCGAYHGYVVAASEAGSVVGTFEAAAVSNAAAVWGTSGPVADSSGNVYATTGNSIGTPNSVATDYSDGVVKLTSSMAVGDTTPADYFQPPAWRSDNGSDLDLGSTGPVLLPNGSQIFVIGKQHVAFLLNTSSLGGSDHLTPVGSLSMCNAMAFGQNAAMGSSAFVACSSGMQQVKLS